MIKWGSFEIHFPTITTRSLVAVIVTGGFVLAVGTLVWITVPKDQLDILDKALVGLGTLGGAVVNGLFNTLKDKTQ